MMILHVGTQTSLLPNLPLVDGADLLAQLANALVQLVEWRAKNLLQLLQLLLTELGHAASCRERRIFILNVAAVQCIHQAAVQCIHQASVHACVSPKKLPHAPSLTDQCVADPEGGAVELEVLWSEHGNR